MNKKIKLILILLLGVGILFVLFYSFRYLISRRHTVGEISTSHVDVGPVETCLEGEGVVEPENEVLMLSPTSGIIKRIYREAGSSVKAGEVILVLDGSEIEEQIERLTDQLAVMRNNLDKNRLNARSIRIDLDYNLEVKKLKITSIKSELTDQKELLEVGGISPARHEKTNQELALAEKELKMVREKNSVRLNQLEVEEKGLLLEIGMHEKQLAERQKLLKKMVVKAPSEGIIMNVNGRLGEKVNADQLLVRMSNLSSFKVKGSIEDKYADMVKTGGSVYVLIDKESLKGSIGRIQPVIEDKQVQFDVFLEKSDYRMLRPNLDVKLRIVAEHKDSTLRIRNCSGIEGNAVQNAFLLKGDKAIRQEITTGLKGNVYTELLSGADTGDVFIITDMSAYKRKNEVDISSQD